MQSSNEAILQAGNLFVYCVHNPVMFVDPTGLSRERAREYMERWWNDRNPDFPYWGSNCANFVSQVLFAGGVGPVHEQWYVMTNFDRSWWMGRVVGSLGTRGVRSRYGINVFFNNASENGMTVLLSDTWNAANAQFNFFSNPDNGFINGRVLTITNTSILELIIRYGNIQVGDLVYFSDDGGQSMFHAAIVSSVSATEIYLAGNTNDWLDEALSPRIRDRTIYIVRLRDEVFSS